MNDVRPLNFDPPDFGTVPTVAINEHAISDAYTPTF